MIALSQIWPATVQGWVTLAQVALPFLLAGLVAVLARYFVRRKQYAAQRQADTSTQQLLRDALANELRKEMELLAKDLNGMGERLRVAENECNATQQQVRDLEKQLGAFTTETRFALQDMENRLGILQTVALKAEADIRVREIARGPEAVALERRLGDMEGNIRNIAHRAGGAD